MEKVGSILRVSGRSDDIINIDGSVSEQLYKEPDKEDYLITNSGSIVQPWYSKNGIWKFVIICEGAEDYIDVKSHKDPDVPVDYSQLLIIKSNINITKVFHVPATKIKDVIIDE